MAGKAFGASDSTLVVATAGSEAALRAMPYVLRSSVAIVAEPTYSSHADAWSRAGAQLHHIQYAGHASKGSTVTLVNPNNPDGAIVSRERVLSLHDTWRDRDGHVVIDEAFADVAPECSVADVAGTSRYPNLVVLRSFGKFYGLAGVRLGFVIAAPALVARFPRCSATGPSRPMRFMQASLLMRTTHGPKQRAPG